jgi:hypothetical protein
VAMAIGAALSPTEDAGVVYRKHVRSSRKVWPRIEVKFGRY